MLVVAVVAVPAVPVAALLFQSELCRRAGHRVAQVLVLAEKQMYEAWLDALFLLLLG